MEDGTEVNMEQVCHHPPISFMLIEGPNGLYRMSSYSSFSPKAHLNSIDLCVKGRKDIIFHDGNKITFNPPPDSFKNTLWGGALVHQITGRVDFLDEANGITAYIEYGDGGVRKNPKDYVKGEIQNRNGSTVSQIFGNYMGYLDFDGERYWDVRKQVNYLPQDLPKTETVLPGGKTSLLLPSDTTFRPDTCQMLAGDVESAQQCKNDLEEIQRRDRKLREAAEKRRKEGGPKISYEPYRK